MKNKNKSKLILILCSFLMIGFVGACDKKQPPSGQPNPSQSPTPIANTNQSQGGVDGGGGNYVGSDSEQIKAIFQGDNGFNLKETIKDVFKTVEFQIINKFIDPASESIFSRMLGSNFSGDPYDVYKDIENSPYELKPEGACLEDIPEGFKDAGTKIDKKESPICFSLDGLNRLPLQAIPFQLVALAVHEHAHHYGFNESDAVKAQQQVLKMMNQNILSGIYKETLSAAADIREKASRLLNNFSTGISDKLLCKHLSEIDAMTSRLIDLSIKIENHFEIRMLVTALDYQFGLTKKSLNGTKDLGILTRGMLAFCGEDPMIDQSQAEQVDEGNRAKLQVYLEKVKSLAHKIVLQAGDRSKGKKE